MNRKLRQILKKIVPVSFLRFVYRFVFRVILHVYMGKPGKVKSVDGINLIGHISGDFGLGESCRIVARSLKASSIPISIYDYKLNSAANQNDTTWSSETCEQLPFGVNLMHINPSEIPLAVFKMGRKAVRKKYNIGFWLWELPEFPEEWAYMTGLLHEIWTPAEFVSESVRKIAKCPVRTMPYSFFRPETDDRFDRAYFGLPEDCFLFLLSYDGFSSSDRKNPLGTVRAFCEAFDPAEDGVGLVIKATHARENDIRQMQALLGDYKNVFILTDSYSKAAFNSLIQCVDVYVSLHRAEGFGLVMAEAMLLRTAVIATDWSANTEFMDSEVACMVPAQLVEIEQDCYPYKKGNHWAQPDEAAASRWMRILYEDTEFRSQLIDKAENRLLEQFSPKKAAEKIQQRFYEMKDRQ